MTFHPVYGGHVCYLPYTCNTWRHSCLISALVTSRILMCCISVFCVSLYVSLCFGVMNVIYKWQCRFLYSPICILSCHFLSINTVLLFCDAHGHSDAVVVVRVGQIECCCWSRFCILWDWKFVDTGITHLVADALWIVCLLIVSISNSFLVVYLFCNSYFTFKWLFVSRVSKIETADSIPYFCLSVVLVFQQSMIVPKWEYYAVFLFCCVTALQRELCAIFLLR